MAPPNRRLLERQSLVFHANYAFGREQMRDCWPGGILSASVMFYILKISCFKTSSPCKIGKCLGDSNTER